MLLVSQNKTRTIKDTELIMIIKGSPQNQEIEIRPLDSNLALASYYSKNEASEVMNRYYAAKKNIYKLEIAKELLTKDEIKKIIDEDYIFIFPEGKIPRRIIDND